MHISGILVVARPSEVDSCIARLRALPGVEVHQALPVSGRIAIVQESGTLDQQQDGLRQIQSLPGVLSAFLVQHVFDPELPEAAQSRLEARR